MLSNLKLFWKSKTLLLFSISTFYYPPLYISCSQSFTICCNDAVVKYNNLKRLKAHPIRTEEARQGLEACVTSTYNGITTNCSDIYDALYTCQAQDHKKEWVKCRDIQRQLEKCAVKNKLGELA